jgi:hypothetical protein
MEPQEQLTLLARREAIKFALQDVASPERSP